VPSFVSVVWVTQAAAQGWTHEHEFWSEQLILTIPETLNIMYQLF
jgi:hypothetical protein